MTAPQPTTPGWSPVSSPPPGRVGLWVGSLALALGIVGGAILLVAGVVTLISGVDDMQRVSVAEGGTVEVTEPGTVSVYAERRARSGNSFGSAPEIDVEVTFPDGAVEGLRTTRLGETYSWDDVEGVLLGRFDAPQPGRYRLRAIVGDRAGPYRTLAVGEPLDGGGVALILGAVFGGGVLVVIGLVTVIVAASRRSRFMRAQAGPVAMFGAPSGGLRPGWVPPPSPASPPPPPPPPPPTSGPFHD